MVGGGMYAVFFNFYFRPRIERKGGLDGPF